MYRVNGKTYRALRSCDATGYHYVTEGDEITEITVSDSSENAKKRIDEYAVKMIHRFFIIVIMDIFISN